MCLRANLLSRPRSMTAYADQAQSGAEFELELWMEFALSLLDAQEQPDKSVKISLVEGIDVSSSDQAQDSVRHALRTSSKQPRQAIIEAWLEVEAALATACERLSVYGS